MIRFLRRRALGAGSIRGMASMLSGREDTSRISVRMHLDPEVQVIRNDMLYQATTFNPDTDWLIRWGCTSRTTGIPLDRQVNPSQAISNVGNKKQYRMALQEVTPHLVPPTVTDLSSTVPQWPLVVRPSRHAQGRNLFLAQDLDDLTTITNTPCMSDGWYASQFIDKVAEYRVYVVSGRVATVARKTPDDPSAVAWNVAQGGRFDVVRWGDWPMEVCRVAIESMVPSGLDFGGVDVMVDADGRAYCIEINSAPSLPLLSDGSVSYRQKCMARCFKYIRVNGKDTLSVDDYDGWRGVIHPAIQGVEL